jgi:hypothetical protein
LQKRARSRKTRETHNRPLLLPLSDTPIARRARATPPLSTPDPSQHDAARRPISPSGATARPRARGRRGARAAAGVRGARRSIGAAAVLPCPPRPRPGRPAARGFGR